MKNPQTITFQEDLFQDHPNCFSGWSEDYVQLIVTTALKEIANQNDMNEVTFSKYTCHAMVETNRYSQVCYIETQKAGYFFVIRNMSEQIIVICNRWD